MDALGLTSRWVAAARARESARADRLFDDPLAASFAGPEGWAILSEMEAAGAMPGAPIENPYLVIRTRLFDDALLAAARAGVAQIAILAAGMDARAFRLDWPAGTTVFEVDRPEVMQFKESVLAAHPPDCPAKRVVIPADLRNDWRSALKAAGHDATRPTAFLVEGLTCYLPDEAAVSAILSTAAEIAAPKSRMMLDVVGASFLTSPWTQKHRDALAKKGVPWLYGTDHPEELMKRSGWPDVTVYQPGDSSIAFRRWPFPVLPRDVPGVPRSFFVAASR